MKELISLAYLLPELKGISYQNLDVIGSNNVQLIINALNRKITFSQTHKIESLNKEKDKATKIKPYQKVILNEIDAKIKIEQQVIENRKMVVKYLSSFLNDNSVKPEIPFLRSYSRIKMGDEIVFFQDRVMQPEEDRNSYLKLGWINAKVIDDCNGSDYVYTVSYDPWTSNGGLGGYYSQKFLHSPGFMRRQDFIMIQEYLNNKIESEFLKIWFKNSNDWYFKTPFSRFKKSITTAKQLLSEEELTERTEDFVKNFYKHSDAAHLWVHRARDMAEMYKIEI